MLTHLAKSNLLPSVCVFMVIIMMFILFSNHQRERRPKQTIDNTTPSTKETEKLKENKTT